MIFFRSKRKYNLPKFPANVIPTFKMLKEVVDDAELESLKEAVERFITEFRQKSKRDPNIDIANAEKLVTVCRYLLGRYQEFDSEGRSLVVAAVRYVAVADDPFCDSTFATGFYDDKKVINYVLESLDIHDRYLALD